VEGEQFGENDVCEPESVDLTSTGTRKEKDEKADESEVDIGSDASVCEGV